METEEEKQVITATECMLSTLFQQRTTYKAKIDKLKAKLKITESATLSRKWILEDIIMYMEQHLKAIKSEMNIIDKLSSWHTSLEILEHAYANELSRGRECAIS